MSGFALRQTRRTRPGEQATAFRRPTVTARCAGAIAVVLGLLFFAVTPAALAESPSALIDDLNDDGVYVSRVRSDVDADALAAAIKEVRFDGLRLVAVAPIDPQPDGAAFARRIQEAVDADAAIVFLADGTLETYVIDDLAPARIRATERAEAVNDPARAVLVFADELTSERVESRPALVSQLIMAVVLLTLVVGLIVGIEQTVTNNRRKRTATS